MDVPVLVAIPHDVMCRSTLVQILVDDIGPYKSIRDVIAFPKTQSASCPLTNAPGEVSPEQLKETGIRLRPKPIE